ncbi:MAG: DNA polymerase III subunit beta [Gaiellaceae bacterium]
MDIETVVETGTGVRLTCERDELVRRLGIVSRALSTRTTVQVLSGILLEAEGERLTLAATDMELSLRSSLVAQIESEGRVVVQGRLLVEIARLLPGGEVTLAHRPEEGIVEITSGSANYRLHTLSAEDFPRLPDATGAQLHSIDADALVSTASQVSRSASRDESRPVLTGVLVRFEGGKLVMAATDSYRMSVRETQVEGDAPDLEAIVPARALSELTRIAGGAGELDLGMHDNQLVFSLPHAGVLLTTRRIDGQFPNYQQLLPDTFEHELTLPREELLEVVRRVAVVSQRNSPLRLRFAEGELTVSARTPDVGEASESLPVPFEGEALEIGFNPEFLREGIESVEGDDIVLRLISPLRPGLLQSPERDFWYLIMPIRLAG